MRLHHIDELCISRGVLTIRFLDQWDLLRLLGKLGARCSDHTLAQFTRQDASLPRSIEACP